jgi:hypothetical protein
MEEGQKRIILPQQGTNFGARRTNLKGRLSTIDLLIKAALFVKK